MIYAMGWRYQAVQQSGGVRARGRPPHRGFPLPRRGDLTLDGIHDRRDKILAYRKIPTLRAYTIVAQDERRVERHWRDESGEWRQGEAVGEGFVPIPCPETKLPLAEIYEGL